MLIVCCAVMGWYEAVLALISNEFKSNRHEIEKLPKVGIQNYFLHWLHSRIFRLSGSLRGQLFKFWNMPWKCQTCVKREFTRQIRGRLFGAFLVPKLIPRFFGQLASSVKWLILNPVSFDMDKETEFQWCLSFYFINHINWFWMKPVL